MTVPVLLPLLLALAAPPAAPGATVLAGPFALEEPLTVRTDAPLRGRIGLDEPLGARLEILLDGERVLHTRGSREAEDWWLADPAAEIHLVEPESGVLVWSYRPGDGFVAGDHEVVVRVDVDGELLESESMAFTVVPRSQPVFLLSARAVPNPFSPVLGTGTRFRLEVIDPFDLRVTVWDREGGRVGEIFRGSLSVGSHEIPWDGRTEEGLPLANGVYLVRFEAVGQPWDLVERVAVWNER